MESLITTFVLAWIPVIILALILVRHNKAKVPLRHGITEAGILCMDVRLKGTGWRLPGGAYAVSFPVFWGIIGTAAYALNAPDLLLQFIVAAFAYQLAFTLPLQGLALLKIFFHGLGEDSGNFPLELHYHICKAVMFVDLLAIAASPLYILGEYLPGEDVSEKVFDAITSIHLIDLLPFFLVGNCLALVSRSLRKIFIKRSSSWLTVSLRFSDFHEGPTR